MTAHGIPMETRFWAKVQKTDGCWLWQAALNGDGYGFFSQRKAHRFAYELVKGPIPRGLTIDHLCRNRRCVNPEHLEPVTQAENVRRSLGFRAIKTACPNGHPYANGNAYLNRKTGWRKCRICHSANMLARYYAKCASKGITTRRDKKISLVSGNSYL